MAAFIVGILTSSFRLVTPYLFAAIGETLGQASGPATAAEGRPPHTHRARAHEADGAIVAQMFSTPWSAPSLR